MKININKGCFDTTITIDNILYEGCLSEFTITSLLEDLGCEEQLIQEQERCEQCGDYGYESEYEVTNENKIEILTKLFEIK
jgi:hypothetical protein